MPDTTRGLYDYDAGGWWFTSEDFGASAPADEDRFMVLVRGRILP